MFFVIECIGIAAFSFIGTVIAIEKRADIIGALIVAFFTTFAGGLMRDLILGYIPQHIFIDPEYFQFEVICVGVSILTYSICFIGPIRKFLLIHSRDFIIDFFDSLGMALFCVAGTMVAESLGFQDRALLSISCGCLTATGGGIIRDLLLAEVPRIFKKHIYLIPAILGTVFYYYTYTPGLLNKLTATIISVLIIMIIRILAIIFKWNLPIPGRRDNKHARNNTK